MRDNVITFLKTKNLGTFALSQELPFDTAGINLVLKNVKRIYVDQEQKETEPYIATMSCIIDQEITTVSVMFSSDAKNQPSDYVTVVDLIKSAKEIYKDYGYFARGVDVNTEYENDLQVTTVELRFNKIL